ncbi:hypothetical protein MMC30_002572 [Trapelia coarctata]|nr:hypothetical protein [Trapelia coarctata]
MSSQRSNSAENAAFFDEDGYEALEIEEPTTSAQHDPDSVRTHVTETQFTENDGLEMDHLSESQNNENLQPATKNSPAAETQAAPPPRHFARPPGLGLSRDEMQEVETQGFTFRRPSMTTMRFGRNIGHSKASIIDSQTIPPPTLSCPGQRSPTRSSIVEPEKTMPYRATSVASQIEQTITNRPSQKHDKIQLGDVSRDQPSDSLVQSTEATLMPIQASLANLFHGSKPGAVNADKDLSQKQIMSSRPGTTQGHPDDNRVSDILPVWSGKAQAQVKEALDQRPEEQHSDKSRPIEPRSVSDGVQPPSTNMRVHSAMRPDPPRPAEPQMMPQMKSKVTKTRRKSKTSKTREPVTPAQSNDTDTVPSQEDLLTILLFKTRQEKRNRDAAKALLQAKEAEVERVQQASEVLRTQMEELSQRESAQREELAKYQTVLPALKIKARKLTDFVAGLTKDHNNLRSNAETIQQQQEELLSCQSDVKTDIAKAHKVLGCNVTNTKKIVAEARDYIAQLEQQVEDRQHQNNDTVSQLEAEQERSDRLEQEIFNISGAQQEMMELLRGLRKATAEKLDEILNQPPSTIPTSDGSQEQMNGILDRCSEILAAIKVVQSSRPDDLRRLDNSFSDYAERFSESLLQLIEASKQCQSDQLKFKRNVQKQFEELTTSIKAEQTLSEQVIDLREVKATLKERAQLSETTLAEARQMVVGLQGREQLLFREIAGLKTEMSTLRDRAREDPEALARLRQIEAQNTEMQAEMTRLLSDSSEATEKLNHNSATIRGLEKQVRALESQLTEVKAANVLLEKQKSGSEAQAHAKYENFKSQLREAANAERAILTEEQSKISQQMQRKKEAAENQAKGLEAEFGVLKMVRASEAEKSDQIQAELEGLRAQVSEEGKELAQLREKLRLTEEDLLSKRAENQLLEEADLNKDKQLSEAEARLAKSISESKSQEEDRLRRINHAVQSFNGSAVGHTNIDEALEAVFRSLGESLKQFSQDAMLDDLTSSQELLYNHGSLELGTPVCHSAEESQELPYRRNIHVHPDRGSPEIPRVHSQGHEAQSQTQNRNSTYTQRSVNRDELVIQESQMEETTIRRNLTTTRSSRGGDSTLMPFQTPRRRSQPVLLYPDEEEHLFSAESPNFNTEDLFPPTPVPASRTGTVVRTSSITEQMQNRHASSSQMGRGRVPSRSGTSQSASIPATKGIGVLRNTSAPRGILKRGPKRKLGSEYGLTPGERPSKKQPNAVEKQGLGPIIPDSQQSPTTSANMQKPRKSRRVSQGHDKFMRRFSGME